ncbi:hypothetical protein CVT25_014476 [Psilocybe cyanescens]|uniref:Uncharacterized protein n=1 Tax=Psilocybe cyanescens TaxID=93625 RepID=A0A409XRL0_PSICY|nr:hypothetical protein CVT25_014476 [Psilocybe cyanescens]
MHFSLLLVVCTLASSAFAAPIPGKDHPVPAPAPAAKPPPPAAAKPAAAANPGDVVIVKSKDFLGPPIKGGGAPNKPHPAVVVAHDDAHVVSVARVGHSIPGTKHTEQASKFGITEQNPHGPSLIDVGPPMQVHQEHLKPVKELPPGTPGLPAKLSPEHLESLKDHIAANEAAASNPGKKQKVEGPTEHKEKPSPAQGLYADLPPPKAPSLYDDLPPPRNNAAADASNPKKRPLEKRYSCDRRDRNCY